MPRMGMSLQWFLPLQGANVGSLVRNENPGRRCACPGLCGAIGLSARPSYIGVLLIFYPLREIEIREIGEICAQNNTPSAWLLPSESLATSYPCAYENPGRHCACPGLCGTIGLSARPSYIGVLLISYPLREIKRGAPAHLRKSA